MLIPYLIKALTEKENVYVNKLGLFSKQYESAQIIDGMVTPPGYKVVFDPDYDGNGFAFTMFVSQKGSMLITNATTQIDQWVSQLKKALDNNKSVSFENFGTFAKDNNGTITFACDRIAELNTDYEGLEPVPLHMENAINQEDSYKQQETEPVESPSEWSQNEKDNTIDKTEALNHEESQQEEITEDKPDEEVQSIEQEPDNQSTEEEEKKEEEEVEVEVEVEGEGDDEGDDDDDDDEVDGNNQEENGKKKGHKGLTILIVLLLLALIAASAYFYREQLIALYQQFLGQRTEIVEKETSPADSISTYNDTADSLNPSDSVATEDEASLFTDSIADDETSSTSPVEQHNNQVKNQLPDGGDFVISFEKGKHYVIVGSFRSEKVSRQHIKERKLEKYNPKIVMQQGSQNMRVCIGIFDTEAEADTYGRSTGMNYWVLN